MRTGKSLTEGSHNLKIWQESTYLILLKNKPKPLKAALKVVSPMYQVCSPYTYHTVVFDSKVHLSGKFHIAKLSWR